jgi:hypothetical protein
MPGRAALRDDVRQGERPQRCGDTGRPPRGGRGWEEGTLVGPGHGAGAGPAGAAAGGGPPAGLPARRRPARSSRHGAGGRVGRARHRPGSRHRAPRGRGAGGRPSNHGSGFDLFSRRPAASVGRPRRRAAAVGRPDGCAGSGDGGTHRRGVRDGLPPRRQAHRLGGPRPGGAHLGRGAGGGAGAAAGAHQLHLLAGLQSRRCHVGIGLRRQHRAAVGDGAAEQTPGSPS